MAIYPLTADDRPDYWACRGDAGVAALCELETVEPIRLPLDDPEQITSGEVLRGYRVHGRAATAAYTTGGEENWGTLGIAADLDRRYRKHRTETITGRLRDAERIRQLHPWHHCGQRCPRRTP
jgi:hypothetical protein